MPDRIIRDELLRSRRFRRLPSDSDRLLFVYLLLSADPFGNLEADAENLGAIVRRDLDDDQAAALLAPLIAADLIRPYTAEGKQLAHIPRYRQRLKYGSGVIHRPPKSIEDPWVQQALDNKDLRAKDSAQTVRAPDAPRKSTGSAPDASLSTRAHALTPAHTGRAPEHPRHDVDVDVEVKRSDVDVDVNRPPPPVDNSIADRTGPKGIGEILSQVKGKPGGMNGSASDHAARVRAQAAAAVAAGSASKAPADWASSEKGITAKALELGMPALPGERWDAWRERLRMADKAGRR